MLFYIFSGFSLFFYVAVFNGFRKGKLPISTAVVVSCCAILFSYLAYMTYPDKTEALREQVYDATYKTCHEKWNANDTMRNSAIFIVQFQFARLDQQSLAPKEAYQAIHFICDIEAKEAQSKIKSIH